MEMARVFDTYTSSEGFEKFIDRGLPEGRIIVAACKDECANGLSEKSRQWFQEMGSAEVVSLGYG